jgi:ADP-ribose pyrophosphatase
VGRPRGAAEDIQAHPGGVDVVATAVNPTSGVREMLFIKIFRIPLNKWVIEWPAGFIDEGETPMQAAIRELKEEGGYVGTPVS